MSTFVEKHADACLSVALEVGMHRGASPGVGAHRHRRHPACSARGWSDAPRCHPLAAPADAAYKLQDTSSSVGAWVRGWERIRGQAYQKPTRFGHPDPRPPAFRLSFWGSDLESRAKDIRELRDLLET